MNHRFLCILAFAASALLVAGPSVGQEAPRWYGIDCSHSRLVVPPGLKCTTTQNFAGGDPGWGGNAGGTFRSWMATDGGNILYYLVEGTSLGSALLASGTLHQVIRTEMRDPSMLRNFSPLGNRGGADYMTFTGASGQACVGIRRYGPAQGGGYQWILFGVRCEPRSQALSDAEIDRFIASVSYRGPQAGG